MKCSTAIVVAVAILALFSQTSQCQTVTCAQVDLALLPCIDYLIGKEEGPSKACCGGVETIKSLAKTTPDKRACCNCIKTAANNLADLKDAAAQSLPHKCNVQFSIPISRNIDCDTLI